MNVVFRTVVYELPPTPLGLLPARICIDHLCSQCRESVEHDDLLAHARSHLARPVTGQEGDAIE